jgi:Holliday junction resolvase RusA-like endonuclease
MRRRFIITGQVRGGKNAIRTTRQGHRYPSKVFEKWSTQAVAEVREQDQFHNTLTIPLGVSFDYTPGDARIRDIPAIIDAVFHVLERAEIVASDNQFRRIGHYYQHPVNRQHPLIVVELWSY